MSAVTLPPAGACKGCRERDKLITQLNRELIDSSLERSALADLAIKNRDKVTRLQRKLNGILEVGT